MRIAAATVLAGALAALIRRADDMAEQRAAATLSEAVRLNATLARRVREGAAALEEAQRAQRHAVEARETLEARLLENRRMLDLVADSGPVMIRVCGPDRNCAYFNRAWLDFTGLTLDEAAGEGWTAVVHPDDVARFLEVRAAAFEADVPFDLEYRLRRRDGVYRWVLEQGKPRHGDDGAPIGFIGSCLDITDRKQNEARLGEAMAQLRLSELRQRESAALAQREQSRIRALLAAMRLGILFEDRDHRVEYVNPAFLRMWAIDKDFDPVGRDTREVIEHSSRTSRGPSTPPGWFYKRCIPMNSATARNWISRTAGS